MNFAVLPRFLSDAYSRSDEITEFYDRFKYASIVSDQRVFVLVVKLRCLTAFTAESVYARSNFFLKGKGEI